MSCKLTPRFNYTLATQAYLSLLKKSPPSLPDKFNFFINNRRLFFFKNARTGLRLLLSSIPRKKLRIGVQAFTCHTVFQAIRKAGHQIVFIDLDNELKLDLDHLNAKLDSLDALIVTHTFGYPEDLDQIRRIYKERSIIEDCSHSFLSEYKGALTGAIGDAAIFSTGLGKFPPIGAGGFCAINSFDNFARFEDQNHKVPLEKKKTSAKEFCKVLFLSIMMEPPVYGMLTYPLGKKLDTRMDFINKFSFSETKGHPWAKTVFENEFYLFNKMLEMQKENAALVSSLLKRKNPAVSTGFSNTPNFYAFPLLVENRDEIYNKLFENNIEAGKHFHKSIEWASEFGYKKGDCPNTELIVKRIITLPIHYGVSRKKITNIAEIVNGLT